MERKSIKTAPIAARNIMPAKYGTILTKIRLNTIKMGPKATRLMPSITMEIQKGLIIQRSLRESDRFHYSSAGFTRIIICSATDRGSKTCQG